MSLHPPSTDDCVRRESEGNIIWLEKELISRSVSALGLLDLPAEVFPHQPDLHGLMSLKCEQSVLDEMVLSVATWLAANGKPPENKVLEVSFGGLSLPCLFAARQGEVFVFLKP